MYAMSIKEEHKGCGSMRNAAVCMLALALGGLSFAGTMYAFYRGHTSGEKSNPPVYKLFERQSPESGDAPAADAWVMAGNTGALRLALAEGMPKAEVERLLRLAALHGRVECMELLLQQPDIAPTTWLDGGKGLVMEALLSGKKDAVRLLLQDDSPLQSAVSPLARCVMLGDAAELRRLIQAGAVELKPVTEFAGLRYIPLLHMAAAAGDAECLRVLLDTPWVNVEERDFENCSAHYRAVQSGSSECVSLLACHPATDEVAWKWYYADPIKEAVVKNRADLVELLVVRRANLKFAEEVLLHAAELGRVECIKAVLAKDEILPDRINIEGNTALHIAARCGQVEALRELLTAAPLPLNSRNNAGETPLQLALKAGHGACAELLAQAGAEFEQVADLPFDSDYPITPTLVRGLLPSGSDWMTARNKQGNTLLHLAAEQGRADSVRMLLALPAVNVNALNLNGESPLQLAVDNGHTECVRLLIEAKGIDLNQVAETLNVAMVNDKDITAVEPLLRAELLSCRHVLHSVCGRNEPELAARLLALPGVNADIRNIDSMTLLAYAARFGATKTLRYLLEKQPHLLNEIDLSGRTPLGLAVSYADHETLAELLRAPGVNLAARDDFGRTVVHSIMDERYTEDTQFDAENKLPLLVAAGVDMNAEGPGGRTPLGDAVYRNQLILTKQLLATPGVDANRLDSAGFAPIHYAVLQDAYDALKLLLESPDVNRNLPDKWGRTPAELIRMRKESECHNLLSEFPATN